MRSILRAAPGAVAGAARIIAPHHAAFDERPPFFPPISYARRRRRLRRHRPAQGRRAAGRRGHRRASRRPRLQRGRVRRAANRPTSSTSARSTWRASSNAWARRRWSPTRWPSSPARAPTRRSRRTRSRWRSTTSSRSARRRSSCRPTGPPAARRGSPIAPAPTALVDGWKRACDLCKVVVGRRRDAGAGRHRRERPDRPGGVVHRHRQPEGAALARRSAGAGDAIVLLASSGIHANGLSLARELPARLPQGYLTPLPGSPCR